MTSDPDPRKLLQLISEGFIFVDQDFRVREMNAEAERIEGRPAESIVGRSIWECWPDLREGPLGALWNKAMAEQKPVSLQHFYTWPGGRSAWIEMRAFPSDHGLSIFFRDISSRRHTEEELKRAQSELIHASRLSAMGALAATLAHELSQPLTAISNYIETGRKTLRPLPAAETREARQVLNLAGAATDRAREILKRLRGFVAKRQIEAAAHDIRTIIADASVLVLPHAQRERVEIEYQLDSGQVWVKADAIQVQQVLVNLIRNAIEAMAGSDERRVAISTRPGRTGMVEVEVRDSGHGLPADRAALFAPFHSSKDEGLGVGLSISRTIIEAHGGTIEAEPAPGRGSIFRFSLPRAASPD